jgi:CHAT domain-containing protein/Tfp pilus assembly protein PilF
MSKNFKAGLVLLGCWALPVCLSLAANAPGDPSVAELESLLLRAGSFREQRAWPQAEELYTQFLAQVGNGPWPARRESPANRLPVLRRQCLFELADVYRRLRRPEQALQFSLEHRRELEKFTGPDVQRLLVENARLLADDYMALENYPAARELLQEALRSPSGEKKLIRLDMLMKLGTLEAVTGRQAAAIECWSEAEQIAEELLNRHYRTLSRAEQIRCTQHLMLCQDARGLPGQADRDLKVLARLQGLGPEAASQRRDAYVEQASQYLLLHNPARAEESLRRALSETSAESAPAARAQLLTMLARLVSGQQRETALLCWSEAAALYERVQKQPRSAEDRAGTLRELRTIYQQMGRLGDATRIAGLLFEHHQQILGADNPVTLESGATLGVLYATAGSYEKARPLFQRSVAYWRTRQPGDPLPLARTLNNAAAVERGIGNYAEAGQLFQEALGLRQKHLASDDPELATSYNNLASNFAAQGNYASAIELYQKLLEICSSAGQRADGLKSTTLLNLAMAYKSQGQFEKAASLCQQALDLQRSIFGEETLGSAAYYNALAGIYRVLGRYADASAAARKTLELCLRNGQPQHISAATAHYYLGGICQREQAYDLAEKHWEEALAIQRREGQQASAARTLNNLGALAYQQGQLARAEKLLRSALAIRDEFDGRPQECYSTLCNLAAVLRQLGNRDSARVTLEQALELPESVRARTTDGESERAGFFWQFASAFDMLVQWSLEDGDYEAAFLAVERGRNRTFLDQLRLGGVDLRTTLADENAGLRTREAALRAQLNEIPARARGLAPQASPAEKQQLADELARVQTDYSQVWVEIRNASPFYRRLLTQDQELCSLNRLREQVLQPHELMLFYYVGSKSSVLLVISPAPEPVRAFPLEISTVAASVLAAELEVVDRGAKDASRSLVGTVKSAKGAETKAAPAVPIARAGGLTQSTATALVNWYLSLVQDRDPVTSRGLIGTVRSAKGAKSEGSAAALANVLLPQEVRRLIEKRRPETLIVIPDGALHRLPLEALVLADGPTLRYGLDELPPIAYSPSANILVNLRSRPKVPTSIASRLLTVGDPAYPQAQQPPALPMLTAQSRGDLAREAFLQFGGEMERLPGTAEECRRIAKAFTADEVVSFLGESATEPNVVSAMKGRGIVHLAAHGLVDERLGNSYGAIALTPPSRGIAEAEEDGFLSYNEILRLPLTECELAVLSACQTNSGPERPLESGSSLAQAFLAAGARRVIASHWSVSDHSTADLMAAFFEAIARDRRAEMPIDYARALQEARLSIRSRPQSSSPYYWAPFVMTGPARQDR